MSKHVLVLGGSYFAGRVFSMVAARNAGFSLTLVNRGTYSMTHLPNTREYACDRHDAVALQSLPAEHYDAVIDFCAYTPGDVKTVFEHLNGTFDHYILLSTADVYDRSIRTPKDETAPLQTCQSSCTAGEYMFHKMLLEGETRQCCESRGTPWTILRPAFIYGPYNYAPREAYFIKNIVKKEPIPVPVDSNSQFQFVYVKDVAEALIACVNNPVSHGKAYNLCAPEVLTYSSYLETLCQVSDIPFQTDPVTVAQVIRNNIPLPFPLLDHENELFIGSKIADELDLCYTPFRDGMQRTYNAFKAVFS